MPESAKEKIAAAHENCEVRENLIKIVERQRSTIAMLLSLFADLGFDMSDFADVLG